MTSGDPDGDVADLPEWFKTFDCAHEYRMDPEVLEKKPIFYRDRMMVTVHAKREAENKHRQLAAQMAAQMNEG